jgi:exosortase A
MSDQAARVSGPVAGAGSVVRREFVTVLLVSLLVWFSWPTLAMLHRRWTDFGYEHGYLVLALSVAMVAREYRRAPLIGGTGSAWGLMSLVVSGVGVIAGQAAAVELMAALFLPVVWFSAVWALFGWTQASRLLAPLAYLYFAVPIWDALTPALQALTVGAVTIGLRAVSVPAFIEGNYIHLPAGTFEVAGGCSGLHYIVVGAALAALLGVLNHERWRTRAVLVIVAIALAVLANWIRVFTIVVAGHLTDMQHYLITEDHYYFGWILFVVSLSPFFYVDHRLSQSPRSGRVSTGSSSVRWEVRRAVVAGLALAVLTLGALYGRHLASSSGADAVAAEIALPAAWRRAGEWIDSRRPVFAGASGEDAAWVTDGTHRVGSYVAVYVGPRQEGEIASSGNRPEGVVSNVMATAARSIQAAVGGSRPFYEIEVLDEGGGRRLVWMQMQVGGVVTASMLQAKLLQVGGVLMGRRSATAAVLTTICETTCDEARHLLSDYATLVGPRLHAKLPPH